MSMSDGRSSRSPIERIGILADDCGLTDNCPLVSHSSLEELEQVIESGKLAYIAVGNALREIRDRKLYKESHKTFETYCRERWDLCRSSAYDYIKAANVGTTLQNQGEDAPKDVKAALAVVEPPKKVKSTPDVDSYVDEQANELESLLTADDQPAPVAAPTAYPKSKTRLLRDEFAQSYSHFDIKPSERDLGEGRHRTDRYDLTLFNLSPMEIKLIANVLAEDAKENVA